MHDDGASVMGVLKKGKPGTVPLGFILLILLLCVATNDYYVFFVGMKRLGCLRKLKGGENNVVATKGRCLGVVDKAVVRP